MNEILSEEEISMILDTFMYTDYSFITEGQSLKSVVESMPYNIDVKGKYAKEYVIISEAVENPEIGELKVKFLSQRMGYNSGTNAVTFINEDKNKVYINFRGTADGEWYDNGNGMTLDETKQQREAVNYFDEVITNLTISDEYDLYLGGHSKGANKVQYITMESEYSMYITKTISVDGQGHSDKAIEKWKKRYSEEEYLDRTKKIYGINGENDFVSVLGKNIIPIENISYVATPIIGMNIAGFHDITNMFAKTKVSADGNNFLTYSGNKNNYVIKQGKFGEWVSKISESLMKLPANLIEGDANTIMGIIELVNKGQITGIDGKFMNGIDLKKFQISGVPIIFSQALLTSDGRQIIDSIINDHSVVKEGPVAENISLNYRVLKLEADELLDISRKLEEIITQMEVTGMSLPYILDGDIYRKPHFDNSMVNMHSIQEAFYRLSAIQMKIAMAYEEFDTTEFCF